jgi:uncharacterized delta-60 repeat protein
MRVNGVLAVFLLVGTCMTARAQFDTISTNLDQSWAANGYRRGTLPGTDFGTVVKKDPLTGGYYVAGSTVNGVEAGIFLTRYTADGIADPGFNGGNPVLIDSMAWMGYFGTSNSWSDTPMGMAIQEDGKIVLCGHTPVGEEPARMLVRRYLPNGLIDPSFNNDGPWPTGLLFSSIGTGVIIDSQQRLICLGAIDFFSNWSNMAVRLNTDGTFDESFNEFGYVIYDVQIGYNSLFNCAYNMSNGDILFAGYHSTPDNDISIQISRFDANGNYVDGFGNAGRITHDMFGHFDWTMDMVVDEPSGRAYLAVLSDGDDDQHADIAVACVDLNTGALVPTFGTGGKLQLDVGGNTGYNDDFLLSIALDEAGLLYGGGSVTVDGQGTSGFLFRWNEQGQLQTGWLDGGMDTTCYVGEVQAMLLDNNGLIVVGYQFDIPEILNGTEAWASADHYIARYGQDVLTGIFNDNGQPSDLLVFPNPTNDLINIHPDAADQIEQIQVFDINGREVLRMGRSTGRAIDLSPLPAGVYSMRVHTRGAVRAIRVVRS